MTLLPPTSKATVSRLAKLRARKGREESGRFLAEGPRVVLEALSAGLCCRALVVSNSASEGEAELLSKVLSACPKGLASLLPEREFGRLCDTRTPQGMIGEFDQPRPPDFETLRDLDGTVVVLDAVRDPGNVGTAVRCAAALGAVGLVLTRGCVDLWNSKTVRASAGAAFRIPIWTDIEVPVLAELLEQESTPIWLTASEGTSLLELDQTPGTVALVFGNEARGVGREWRRIKGLQTVSLPMSAGVESLNVASAVAAILGILMTKGGRGRG